MSPFKSFPPVGSEAPAFSMRDAAGSEHSTLAARGKWLVLYFYPKDDTPGCTIEACEFRDSETALQAAGAIVWGVSPDDQSSKAAFRAARLREHLPDRIREDHRSPRFMQVAVRVEGESRGGL